MITREEAPKPKATKEHLYTFSRFTIGDITVSMIPKNSFPKAYLENNPDFSVSLEINMSSESRSKKIGNVVMEVSLKDVDNIELLIKELLNRNLSPVKILNYLRDNF